MSAVFLARRKDGRNAENLRHLGKGNCLLCRKVAVDVLDELHGPHLMVDQEVTVSSRITGVIEKINVDTENAVVTLKGSVKSQAEANQAEKLAKETKGVERVISELKVGH